MHKHIILSIIHIDTFHGNSHHLCTGCNNSLPHKLVRAEFSCSHEQTGSKLPPPDNKLIHIYLSFYVVISNIFFITIPYRHYLISPIPREESGKIYIIRQNNSCKNKDEHIIRRKSHV